MKEARAQHYYGTRFHKVLEHIDVHLDSELSVERISAVAAFSRFHFHRQFSALFGIGVCKYVQLLRLRRASYQLALEPHLGILEIALHSGYESHEAFSRAFKRVFMQTPSEFRDQPAWNSWAAVDQTLKKLRSLAMTFDSQMRNIEIVNFVQTHVGAVEHRGDPGRVLESVRKLIGWRKQNKLPPAVSATFNILYDDPSTTEPEDYRLDVCVAVTRAVSPNAFGVVAKTIPSGRCALLRHVGSDDTLFESVQYLYRTWLPSSGEELRDFPLFLQRVRFFPEVAEHESVTDVFLPIC